MTNYNTTPGKESKRKTKYQTQRNDVFCKPRVISLMWLSEDISNYYIMFQEWNEAPREVKVGMLLSTSWEIDCVFLVIRKLQSRKIPPTGDVTHKGIARINEAPESIFPSRVGIEIKQKKQKRLWVFSYWLGLSKWTFQLLPLPQITSPFLVLLMWIASGCCWYATCTFLCWARPS